MKQKNFLLILLLALGFFSVFAVIFTFFFKNAQKVSYPLTSEVKEDEITVEVKKDTDILRLVLRHGGKKEDIKEAICNSERQNDVYVIRVGKEERSVMIREYGQGKEVIEATTHPLSALPPLGGKCQD